MATGRDVIYAPGPHDSRVKCVEYAVSAWMCGHILVKVFEIHKCEDFFIVSKQCIMHKTLNNQITNE